MKTVLITLTLAFSTFAASDTCYQFSGLGDGQGYQLSEMRKSLEVDDPAGIKITSSLYINLFDMDMTKISSEYAPSSKRNMRIKVITKKGGVEYANIYMLISSSATRSGLSFSVYEKKGRDFSFSPQFDHIVCVNK